MLYFVATPIGNLADITFRAIEILNSVDLIACEDTRHSLSLLNHYNIKKPLLSCHKFNERESAEKICAQLSQGKNVAVISDAGTPVISDPGNILSQILIEKGFEFTVIPGACAFVPALILSGFNCSSFTFIGFLPEKKAEAEKLLQNYLPLTTPLIFYVAPHDIEKTTQVLYEILGDRRAVAVREITKIYEERIEFSLKEGYKGERRGEFVLIVEGNLLKQDETVNPLEMVDNLIKLGASKMDAIKQTAKELGIKKNELYKMVVESEEN